MSMTSGPIVPSRTGSSLVTPVAGFRSSKLLLLFMRSSAGVLLRVSHTAAVRREHSAALHARALESRRYARSERVLANMSAAMLAARIEKQSSMHAVEQFHNVEFTSSRLRANSFAARMSGRASTQRGIVVPAYFLRNLSTRPAVSTIFCLPVKKGWQLEQTSTFRSCPTVDRVLNVLPQ